ncbi:hypothetical protein [Helicobacter pylori]|uniref:hypothetical protein n=1 Tax=Helicobacter pylori TaxID=210 RepID=UPI000EAE4DDB|nr:hypothetical protein [Helicobacter pylori]
MWNEKVIKIIPAVLFLFCLLECFEMVLIITNLNKVEKLEVKFEKNLEALKTNATLLNKHFRMHG